MGSKLWIMHHRSLQLNAPVHALLPIEACGCGLVLQHWFCELLASHQHLLALVVRMHNCFEIALICF
jgi:hypothetical protein